jgi:hypothetical protein
MTGNKQFNTIVGTDQLLLAITALAVYPDSEADEIAAFIYNNGGDLYSRQAIATRMKELRITRKVSSTEAYQAFTPNAILRCDLFWSRAPPLGVRTIERRRL